MKLGLIVRILSHERYHPACADASSRDSHRVSIPGSLERGNQLRIRTRKSRRRAGDAFLAISTYF